MKSPLKRHHTKSKISSLHSAVIFLVLSLIPFIVIYYWDYSSFFSPKREIIENVVESKPTTINKTRFHCDFTPSIEPSSTKKDVVILFTNLITPGLYLAIQSLRTTGSNCRIVLLTPTNFVPEEEFNDLIKVFDIEIVNTCDERKVRMFVPHMLRYECELDWLEKNRKNISRVFHSDSLDVFFQGDPFTEAIPYESLVFVVEPHCIKMCGWNLAWIEDCYGKTIQEEMKDNFIVCSGSIGGNAEDYIKLLNLMISQNEWKSCFKPSRDQPILNYLIWKGLVDEAGIRYKFTGCENGLFTAQWCIINNSPIINNNSLVTTELGSIPSYVHQYNRLEPLTKMLMKMCHIYYHKPSTGRYKINA